MLRSTQKVVELLHVFASLLRIVRLVRMGVSAQIQYPLMSIRQQETLA